MHKFNTILYPNIVRDNAKIRLFCFPYSGAGRSAFHPWITHFKDTIAPFTIQYSGHGGRVKEPLESDINILVSELYNEILLLSDKPFAVYAHSLGATIAYEVLLKLQKNHNIQPCCFFTTGRPPHINNEKRGKRIKLMTDDELLQVIKNYNLTPDWLLKDTTIMSYYLPVLRNDFILYQEYINTQKNKLNCPIYAMVGEKDSALSIDTVKEWSLNTNNDFHFKLFKGDHFYFKDACEAQELVNYMENELDIYIS